ncbi:MAG: SOS response-associated peptidase [Betaproteobacteria bacterium]|nr:SOS response-associated peptidase [Betaproteobacteria bacterium]
MGSAQGTGPPGTGQACAILSPVCSRYFLDADGNVIAYTFHVPVHDRIRKRFNIAPTQEAPVVRIDGAGGREVALLRWGLVPSWSKDIAIGNRMINARSETVAEKPSFRNAYRSRRCVVPATGFFEWKGEPGRKQPYAITAEDQPLFALAGLWERWHDRASPEAPPVETFTILTTEANETVAPVHDRMPVILPAERVQDWLAAPPAEVRALLVPYAGPLRVRAVSKLVGNPRNDSPELLADA